MVYLLNEYCFSKMPVIIEQTLALNSILRLRRFEPVLIGKFERCKVRLLQYLANIGWSDKTNYEKFCLKGKKESLLWKVQ